MPRSPNQRLGHRFVLPSRTPVLGLSPAERRDSYRFDVRGLARLQLPAAVHLPVVDLSASGMALNLHRQQLHSLDTGHAVFQLGANFAFEARFDTVSTCDAGADRFRVGTRFSHLNRNALWKLSQFLVGKLMSRSSQSASRLVNTESALVSEERDFVAALLRFHGVTLRRPVRAYIDERALSNKLAITAVLEDRIQIASLLPLPADYQPGSELLFLISTAGSALWFRSVLRHVEPHRAELTFPDRIVRSGFRDSFRAAVDRTDVEVRFRHPRLPFTVSKQALDVSARGLSFPLDLRRDILFPGDRLETMQIQLPQGWVEAGAIVRSVRQLAAGGMGCGVELLEISNPSRWAAAVFRSGHPNTMLSDDDAPEGAWRALDTSGYVSLWTHPRAQASAKRDFQRVWQAMPKNHGHVLVVKRDHQAVGTIAANRLYRQTWMMHLLGVDKDARREEDRASFYRITRELYTGLVFTLQHLTDLKYLVGYFGSESHWNDTVHMGFEREYPIRSHLACSRYAIYRTALGPNPLIPTLHKRRFRIRPLGTSDMELVLSGIGRRFSPMECEAYDYREVSLLKDSFGGECQQDGYERLRECFVVVDEQDLPAALLMMETGAESVNLFNLMNVCRFVPLRSPSLEANAVRGAALEGARFYYERAGKRTHLFFDYDRRPGEAEEYAGYHFLCDGLSWLLHRAALPAWLSYLDDLLGVKADESSRRTRREGVS